MATTTTGHPGRTLIVLAVLVAGLITLMAVGNTWAPKLGSKGKETISVRRLDELYDEAVAGIDDPRVYLKLDRLAVRSAIRHLGHADLLRTMLDPPPDKSAARFTRYIPGAVLAALEDVSGILPAARAGRECSRGPNGPAG